METYHLMRSLALHRPAYTLRCFSSVINSSHAQESYRHNSSSFKSSKRRAWENKATMSKGMFSDLELHNMLKKDRINPKIDSANAHESKRDTKMSFQESCGAHKEDIKGENPPSLQDAHDSPHDENGDKSSTRGHSKPKGPLSRHVQHKVDSCMPMVKLWHTYVKKERGETIVLDGNREGNDAVVIRGDNDKPLKLLHSDIWKASVLVRATPHVRDHYKVAVTGGEETIKTIWCEYGIRPNVVYIPDDLKEIPDWCVTMARESPTIIYRARGADINRVLLSADFNDGFAAEFPIDAIPQMDPLSLTLPLKDGNVATRINSAIVLQQLRIPSNVGILLRAALEQGYDTVILDRCVDVYSEKVIRASGGAVLSPKLKVVQIKSTGDAAADDERSLAIIQKMAVVHRLLPLAAVPDQSAPPISDVVRKMFFYDRQKEIAGQRGAQQGENAISAHIGGKEGPGTSASNPCSGASAGPSHIGPMLLLGSESQGLVNLLSKWNTTEEGRSQLINYQLVSLEMINNYVVGSMNVGVAGTILMHAVRPQAFVELNKLAEEGIIEDDELE
eukprot:Tbor_TRINITY_DN7628_c0_g1::TRINITY_DN7628_c0_g1_i1::g.1005::m.1005